MVLCAILARKTDYYGVGPVCWKHCDSGYRDDGATCYKSITHFYAKDSYGRGAGSPLNSCGSGQEQNGQLCCAPIASPVTQDRARGCPGRIVPAAFTMTVRSAAKTPTSSPRAPMGAEPVTSPRVAAPRALPGR